jgi:tetratricopeptide (TPR) repeat protein
MSDWIDAEQHADRAATLLESGRLAEAEAAFRRALAIDSAQADWHFQLGLLLEMSGRDIEAVESFDRASTAAPDMRDYVDAAASVSMRLGDTVQAEARLARLAQLCPDDPDVWPRLITARATLGQHDEAETTFYLAEMHLDRTTAPCLVSLGESLMSRQLWDKATWCMEEATRREPAYAAAYQGLAEIHRANARPQEAMKLYRWLLDQFMGDASTAVRYAELLATSEQYDEASAVLRQVLEHDPVHVEAHFQMGELAMAQDQFQHAALAFQLVRRLDRGHERCDRALGEALLYLGQIGDARRLLSLAAKKHTESQSAEATGSLSRFGAVLLGAELAEEAVFVFEQVAQQTRWTDLHVLRALARSRYLAGDVAGGRSVSRRVLRLSPTCVASLSNLGLASLQERRLREASGWIQRGLRAHPADEGLRQLRFKLLLHRIKKMCRSVVGL